MTTVIAGKQRIGHICLTTSRNEEKQRLNV